MCCRVSMPSIPGIFDVQEHDVEELVRKLLQGIFPRVAPFGGIARLLQPDPQRLPDGEFVIHYEDACFPCHCKPLGAPDCRTTRILGGTTYFGGVGKCEALPTIPAATRDPCPPRKKHHRKLR